MSALELKISPVMLTLLIAAGMWQLGRHAPGWVMTAELRVALLVLFLLIAAAVGGAGIQSFRAAQTTVNPWRPGKATALVQEGIYRFTRNPMYLALLCALLGWGFYLANPFALALTIVFVLYLNRFQIQPEERILHSIFDGEYEAYCRRVRRWI